MAAKLKVIKTANEFNLLTSVQTLGDKTGVVVFFDGSQGSWKQQLSDYNDCAGDLFDEASLIGVDVRFFPDIVKKFGGEKGKAALFKKDPANFKLIDAEPAKIKAAAK